VKNAWSYIFTPPNIVMLSYLVKHRDNFTFYFAKFLLSFKVQVFVTGKVVPVLELSTMPWRRIGGLEV